MPYKVRSEQQQQRLAQSLPESAAELPQLRTVRALSLQLHVYPLECGLHPLECGFSLNQLVGSGSSWLSPKSVEWLRTVGHSKPDARSLVRICRTLQASGQQLHAPVLLSMSICRTTCASQSPGTWATATEITQLWPLHIIGLISKSANLDSSLKQFASSRLGT